MAKLLTNIDECTEALLAEGRVAILSIPTSIPVTGFVEIKVFSVFTKETVMSAFAGEQLVGMMDKETFESLKDFNRHLTIILDKPHDNYTQAEIRAELAEGTQDDVWDALLKMP